MHSKSDHITVLNMYTKSHLESAQAFAKHFSNKLLSRFSHSRYSVHIRELPADLPLRTAVLAAVKAENADLAVLGFRGSKENCTLMGSSDDLSLREGRTSALVIKSWDAKQASEGQVLLVGLDGSTRSQEALLLAARLSRTGRDKVHALYVEDIAAGGVAGERDGDVIEKAASGLLEACRAKGCDITFIRRSIKGFHNPGAVIKSVADELSATMVIIGADGLGATLDEQKTGLGSCSDAVLRTVSCNVLIFHAPRQLESTAPSSSSGGGGGAAPPK